MSEIKGAATLRGVTVEVHPGGALAALTLSAEAFSHGAPALATAVVEAVESATAVANQRTRHALREALAGLDLEVLGLTQDAARTEQAEATTPDTWRAR